MTTDIKDLLTKYLETGPFHKFLGMKLLSHDAKAGKVEISLPWKADFERMAGSKQWHGGPIAALIDIAGDFALIATLGRAIPTINLRIDYLRPAIDTNLVAEARTLRAGKSVGVVDIDIRDGQGRIVAVGRGSYSTLPSA